MGNLANTSIGVVASFITKCAAADNKTSIQDLQELAEHVVGGQLTDIINNFDAYASMLKERHALATPGAKLKVKHLHASFAWHDGEYEVLAVINDAIHFTDGSAIGLFNEEVTFEKV